MIEVRQTPAFRRRLLGLNDERAFERIGRRIARLQVGLFGDAKSVGGGVSELRVDYGPGYRVYFTRRGKEVVILLAGGGKGTQGADIKEAKAIRAELLEGDDEN